MSKGEADGGKEEPLSKPVAARELWNSSVDSGNREEIVSAGAIPALLTIVVKGPIDAKVASIGCLSFLLKEEDDDEPVEVKEEFLANKGIASLTTMYKSCAEDGLSVTGKVFQAALDITVAAALDSKERILQIVTGKGIETLVEVLDSDEDTCARASFCLYQVSREAAAQHLIIPRLKTLVRMIASENNDARK
ncbi:hypothetical protein BSKO_09337 [Bryopsis sp. KO-2023]|nr:hypothetical protein BSKO_09337 [Bryopsis sp. KO-2023]